MKHSLQRKGCCLKWFYHKYILEILFIKQKKSGNLLYEVRQLFKGGNYSIIGGFGCGNYSREESIQGRKLFAEIRY